MNNALRAKETASQIISNKDINIEATDKVKAKSVDIYAKNDVNISGDNGVEISTANNSYDNTTKQSSSRIGANFGVNSAIVNTVENVKNIKELTDFSGNSYDILNNASKVVGAIKDGAKATIAVADTNYKGATDAGYDNLKIGKNIFTASVSYNKSESKSSVHNETVEKSSLVSGNNMNIKSKNGNISISGTDVPNTSIKHDKVDKEQINRASAINTDFEISGKKTSAEDLGFNTDISRAQEKTKDEERHLDAELHTDLIGEDKRNEIKYAFKKLGSLHEILDQKKFKESMEGVLLDKFKDEHQKEFNLIKEESLSLEDKQKIAQNLVERYLRENGYQGEIPEVLLTDEAHSFSVDSKDKETGAKRREKIYFSKNDIADPNLAFSRLFGHEKAHMNTYDEGKDGEETSLHTTRKIGSENKNKLFTEKEKADYLNNLRNKYKDQKSIEQQFAEAKLVPEKDKENFTPFSYSVSGSLAVAVDNSGTGRTYTQYVMKDIPNNRVEVVITKEGDIGVAGPYDVGGSLSFGIYNLKSYDEFGNNVTATGASVDPLWAYNKVFTGSDEGLGITTGVEKVTNEKKGFIGFRLYLGKSFKNYEFHSKTGIDNMTEVVSREVYTIYEYLEKYHKRGGRNSWK